MLLASFGLMLLPESPLTVATAIRRRVSESVCREGRGILRGVPALPLLIFFAGEAVQWR
jgi:hypothetical protein